MNEVRLAYLDGASGLAGDMLLGAVIAAGVPPQLLERRLTRALHLTGWRFETKQVLRQGLPAVHVSVVGDRVLPSLAWILWSIAQATLPSTVREQALSAIHHLMAAERAAHRGRGPAALASLDTLVDVIGGPLGLALLKVHQVWASPFNGGTLSPAALAIVRATHIPIYTDGTPHELVTPTGAALAASLIRRFGHLPLVTVETFGCGAGSRELNERPNLLRLIIGRVSGVIGTTPEPVGTTPEPLGTTPEPIGTPPVPAAHLSTVLLLETQMDDMDPRVYPHLMEQLLQAGALDVWLTPITMKKGRPGLLLSVLALPHDETALAGILFRETTTLGIRRLPLERWILPRRAVPTSAARRLRYKEAHLGPGQWRRSVEYESARRLALRENAPLHQLLTTPTNRYGTPTKSE